VIRCTDAAIADISTTLIEGIHRNPYLRIRLFKTSLNRGNVPGAGPPKKSLKKFDINSPEKSLPTEEKVINLF